MNTSHKHTLNLSVNIVLARVKTGSFSKFLSAKLKAAACLLSLSALLVQIHSFDKLYFCQQANRALVDNFCRFYSQRVIFIVTIAHLRRRHCHHRHLFLKLRHCHRHQKSSRSTRLVSSLVAISFLKNLPLCILQFVCDKRKLHKELLLWNRKRLV